MLYLLHFSRPFRHARHYLGYCEEGNLSKRVAQHRCGNGSKLMRAVKQAGIEFEVARVWPGLGRHDERRKKQRGHAWQCPLCKRENGNGKDPAASDER